MFFFSKRLNNDFMCECCQVVFDCKLILFYFLFQVILVFSVGVFKVRFLERISFKKCYDRGDFLIVLEYDIKGNKIVWKVEIERFDYYYYFLFFFEGLFEILYFCEFFV